MGIEEYKFVAQYGMPSPTNILFMDYDPEKAAQAHCDRHVASMVLDAAQLLSTAWHELHGTGAEQEIPKLLQRNVFPALRGEAAAKRFAEAIPCGENYNSEWRMFAQRVYAPVHVNHPCAVWARELGGNYIWLWQMGMALAAEHLYRFGKPHFAHGVLYTLELVPPALVDTAGDWQEAPVIMPEPFKVRDETGQFYNSVASYRKCYAVFKQSILSYTRRKCPDWLEVRNGKFVLKHADT